MYSRLQDTENEVVWKGREEYPALNSKGYVTSLIHAWSLWNCVGQGHAKVPGRTMKGNTASPDNCTR